MHGSHSRASRPLSIIGQHNSSAVVIALLLVLVAVVLLSHHLAMSAIGGVWVDRVSAIAFVVLGALLLRAASRSA